MNLIFGMIIGASLAGGGGDTTRSQMLQTLSQIPFRCFAALEESEAAYRECRSPSLSAELHAQTAFGNQYNSRCTESWAGRRDAESWKTACDRTQAITWEIAAIKALATAAAEKKKP